MKKLILTIALATTIGSAVFAQGSFIFQTGARYLWDDWSALAPKADASNNFALFIGTGTPSVVQAGGGGVATNAVALPGGLTIAQAWSDILGDSSFLLATNSSTAGGVIGGPTSLVGGISYLGGATFLVNGTASSGGTATLYVVGWSDLYATPQAAALAGSPVGWSTAFSYAYAAGPNPGPAGTPGNDSSVLSPFGVFAPVPEPTTIALASLGGLSLLAFRRRNKA
jgi:hypothetical protein